MTRNDVINIANGLTGNEGHNKILKIYNSQKNLPRGYTVRINDPWCATFVSAVLTMAGYDSINECSCNEMTKKAKSLGIIKIPYNDAPDFETRKARLIEFVDNIDWTKVTKNDIIKAIKEGL